MKESLESIMLRCCLAQAKEQFVEHFDDWDNTIVYDDISYTNMRLAPYLLSRLEKFNLKSKYHKRLQNLYKYWWLKSHFHIDELEKVSKMLAMHNIKPIVLKGGSIYHLYQKKENRTMSDIDLLIDYNDVNKAVDLLSVQGFIPNKSILSLLKRFPKNLRHYKHSIQLYNPIKKVELDLHWSCGSGLTRRFTSDLINDCIEHPECEYAKIPHISHNLLLTIIHAVVNNSFTNFNWVLDIYEINKNHLRSTDWNQIISLATKYNRLVEFLVGTKILSSYGLNLPINSSLYKENSRAIQRFESRHGGMITQETFYHKMKQSIYRVNSRFERDSIITRIYHQFMRWYFFFYLKAIDKANT